MLYIYSTPVYISLFYGIYAMHSNKCAGVYNIYGYIAQSLKLQQPNFWRGILWKII